MGQLLQKMVDRIALLGQNKETRMLMLGLDGAGKTTILYKLKLGESISTVPTIGFNVENVQYKKLSMTIWDIGGQTRLRKLWHHYFIGTQALIFVVDISDTERLEEVKETLGYLNNCPELQDTPLLVYANKSDLVSISPSEMANKLGFNGLRKSWFIQKTCALNGEGLYEGLDWLSKEMKLQK